MKRLWFTMLVVLAVVATTMTSCGGDGKDGKKSSKKNEYKLVKFDDESKNLTFMMWGSPEEKSSVFKVLKAYQKENTNVGIKVIHVDSLNYSDKLQVMFAGGKAPDVFYLHQQDFINYAKKGNLYNLTDNEDDEDLNIKDFYPKLLNAFRYGGGDLYGIPKDWTPFVLYYNMDLFEKAGLKMPNNNWTWDDFLKAAKALTMDTNKDGIIDQYGFVIETWADWYYSWLKQNKGEMFENNKWVFGQGKNLDANAETIQFIADLTTKGEYKVAPDISTSKQLGKDEMFMNGGAAMCMYGRWVQLKFKKITDFKWNYVVLPKRKTRAATVVTVALCMKSDIGDKADMAWDLLKYVTSFKGQIFTAKSGLAMPSRKSLVASEHYLKASEIIKNQPHLAKESPKDDPMIQSLDFSVMLPTHSKWMEIRLKMDEKLEDVFLGNKQAKSVILDLDSMVNDIIK